MMSFIILFAGSMVFGYFLAHFPVGTCSAEERIAQLGVVALLVIVPYLTWRRVNYRHALPITIITLATLGLMLWSCGASWSVPLVLNLRPLAVLACQAGIVFIICLAYTQVNAERHSTA